MQEQIVAKYGDGMIRDEWYLNNVKSNNKYKVLIRKYNAEETIFVPKDFAPF